MDAFDNAIYTADIQEVAQTITKVKIIAPVTASFTAFKTRRHFSPQVGSSF
ncbi:MAG: hypothetical protein HYZ31_13715 [Gammaproteobacteria bacterium]|nr:hypothetical protein [Gammaproteobacteria bacterium]